MWPCSNNAGNTTWRRSNSSESSLTGTSLQENKRLVTASVLPKRKTNKQAKQTFVPLNVQVRAQVSAGSREVKGAKEDVVTFKINVSHSRGYMKLSDWRFCSIRMVLEENMLGKLGKFRIANGDSARVTNTNFLLTFSIYNQEKRLGELIKWSPKRKYFDLLSTSLN